MSSLQDLATTMGSDVSEKEAELPFLYVASGLEEDAKNDERSIEGIELKGKILKLLENIQEDQREQRNESRQNQEEDKDKMHRIMEQLQQMQKEHKLGMQKLQEQLEENQERVQKLLELSEENHKQQLTERDNDINKMRDEYQNLAAKLEEIRNIGGQELLNSDAELVRLRDSHEKLESRYKEKITEHETAMEKNKAKIGNLLLKIRAFEKTVKDAESREKENEYEKKKLEKKLNNLTQKFDRQQNEMKQLLLWKDKVQMYLANAKRSQTDPDITVRIVNNVAMKNNQGNATQYNITRKGNK